MKTKQCTMCRKIKPLSAFYSYRKGAAVRFRSRCSKCFLSQKNARRANMTPDERQTYLASLRSYVRTWKIKHPFHVKAQLANRRAEAIGAVGSISPADVKATWDKHGGQCWVCGDVANELDHFRPVNPTSGGTNTADNIRPICSGCNQKREHGWHGEAFAQKEAALLRKLKRLRSKCGKVPPVVGSFRV